MQSLGPAGLFVFLAGVFALFSLFVFWRGFTTPSVPVAEQSRFVTIVAANTSPAILELDPRYDLYMETPHVFDELHSGSGTAHAQPESERDELPPSAGRPGV